MSNLTINARNVTGNPGVLPVSIILTDLNGSPVDGTLSSEAWAVVKP